MDDEVGRPTEIKPGQRWGLWVYDDVLYERITVLGPVAIGVGGEVLDRYVVGQTESGGPCVVGVGRLLKDGDYLGREDPDAPVVLQARLELLAEIERCAVDLLEASTPFLVLAVPARREQVDAVERLAKARAALQTLLRQSRGAQTDDDRR